MNTKEEFDSLKKKILDICQEKFDDKIIPYIIEKIEKKQREKEIVFKEKEDKEVKKQVAQNYMLTTGYNFDGFKIKKYMGVISGQVVLGTGFLSEFTASFADFFGEESDKFANKLEQAKNAATTKLIDKSIEKGGNALIGVDFDYITFRNNMIGVVANGTSVLVENEVDNVVKN